MHKGLFIPQIMNNINDMLGMELIDLIFTEAAMRGVL